MNEIIFKNSIKTNLSVRVLEAVNVKDWNNVPVIAVSQISHLGILGGQQLVDEPRGSGGGDPFPGVDVGLDENAGIARFVGYLDAANSASLVGLADHELLCDGGIFSQNFIQPGLDLLQLVVLSPAKGGAIGCGGGHLLFIDKPVGGSEITIFMASNELALIVG